MEQLGLKGSSRDLQLNCAISYLFYLYLMLHTCAARFDVRGQGLSLLSLLQLTSEQGWILANTVAVSFPQK